MRRLAAIGATLAVAACGRSRSGLEDRIRADLARQLGVPVSGVRCPAGPYPKTCTADLPGTPALPLTLTQGPDGIAWSLDGFVIGTAILAVQVGVELDDLGVDARVDCGPPYRLAQVGDRIRCDLDLGGTTGAAWARILDDDGRFDLELALDPAAVAARTADRDEAALERTSAALDRDEPTGEDGDDDGAALPDAGADGGS